MIQRMNLVIGGFLLSLGVVAFFNSCTTIPKQAVAVKPFDANKYLGKWYEIARFDFRFEKDLSNVSAEYSLINPQTIKVVNRGYNYIKQKNVEAVGKAKFVGAPDQAKLKVSFFGPFYSGYNVIAIDPEYKYALVVGKNLKYLWLLSRETTMPDDVKLAYLQKANELGCDTSKLVWTKQQQ